MQAILRGRWARASLRALRAQLDEEQQKYEAATTLQAYRRGAASRRITDKWFEVVRQAQAAHRLQGLARGWKQRQSISLSLGDRPQSQPQPDPHSLPRPDSRLEPSPRPQSQPQTQARVRQPPSHPPPSPPPSPSAGRQLFRLSSAGSSMRVLPNLAESSRSSASSRLSGSQSRTGYESSAEGGPPASKVAGVAGAPSMLLKWRRKANDANDVTAFKRWSVARVREKVSHVEAAVKERDAGRSAAERKAAKQLSSRFASATFQAQLQQKLNEMNWRPEWEYRLRLYLAWLFNFAVFAVFLLISIIYAAEFGNKRTRSMVISWLLAYGVTFALVEPIQVLIIACAPSLFDDSTRCGRMCQLCRFVYNELFAP